MCLFPPMRKTDAVLLYSEDTSDLFQRNGKIKNTKRRVYKILLLAARDSEQCAQTSIRKRR